MSFSNATTTVLDGACTSLAILCSDSLPLGFSDERILSVARLPSVEAAARRPSMQDARGP